MLTNARAIMTLPLPQPNNFNAKPLSNFTPPTYATRLTPLHCLLAGLAEEATAPQQYSPASQQEGEVPSPHSRTATPLGCLSYVAADPDHQHQPQQDGGGTYATGTLRADGEFVIFNRFEDVSERGWAGFEAERVDGATGDLSWFELLFLF